MASAASPLVNGLLSSPILGQALGGLGQGMMAKSQAEEADREREAIAANYNTEGGPLANGLLSPYQPPSTGTGSADSFGQMGQWVYDERLGRLVRRQAA